jgi:hypothetical protein
MYELLELGLKRARAEMAEARDKLTDLGQALEHPGAEPEPEWLIRARERELDLLQRKALAERNRSPLGTAGIIEDLQKVQLKIANHARQSPALLDGKGSAPSQLVKRLRAQEARARHEIAAFKGRLAELDREAAEFEAAQQAADDAAEELAEFEAEEARQRAQRLAEFRAKRRKRQH